MTKDELQAKRAVALSEVKNIEVALCLDEHYIDIIEKENAELKHTIAELRRDKDVLNIHTKAQEKIAEYRGEQLTKAKELLKEFMRISVASVEEYEPEFSELIGQTEQFLKDEPQSSWDTSCTAPFRTTLC